MNKVNTDCSKCKAPMPEIPPPKGATPLDMAAMTVTAYRCYKCGHWNDLNRRKPLRADGNVSENYVNK